jgi:hypothetical protein
MRYRVIAVGWLAGWVCLGVTGRCSRIQPLPLAPVCSLLFDDESYSSGPEPRLVCQNARISTVRGDPLTRKYR